MKIAFIVQRSGKEVFGGAEALTLQAGIALSKTLDVEILTTRAKDASTWKNYYPEGEEKIDNLVIRRFSVDHERDPNFVPLSQFLEKNNDDLKKGKKFIDASGPTCNKLIEYLKNNQDNYDLLIFVSYPYWQTFYGLDIAPEKSILLSTAHDEPWIHFKIYEKVFQLPRGFLFLTNAEKEFVLKKFGQKTKPFQIVGHGLDSTIVSKNYTFSKLKLPENYILYIGRISAGKGCQILSDYFNKYQQTHFTKLKLVMIGNLEQKIVNNNALVLENLTDEEKFFILKNCRIFVMPSQNESLNIACLEAWLFKKPVIVNSKSPVLLEHCKNSQGGIYFENYEEFAECLDLLLENNSISNKLAENGEKYVKDNYNWSVTTEKYKSFFTKILKQEISN